MLLRANEHIKSIIKTIEIMSQSAGVESVYRDWCECMALSISNGCRFLHDETWNKREKAYLDIAKKYKDKSSISYFTQMFSDLTNAFEIDPFNDYLGQIYMELMGGNKMLGQCFTPMSLCEVCAGTTIGDDIPEEVKTLADDCSGGGAMLIAACKHYYDHNVNYQKYLKIVAGDLDRLCVFMSYVQLSLIGARAVVYHHDAITQEVYDRFVTPMECLFYPFAR